MNENNTDTPALIPPATQDTVASPMPVSPLAATRSTGPKTPEGKARSRLNALKTGLFTKVLPSYYMPADGVDHDTLIAQLQEDFHPETQTEMMLVESIAINQLRLRRILMMEEAIIEPHPEVINERVPRPLLSKNAVVDDVDGTTREQALLERFVQAIEHNSRFDFTRDEACELADTLYAEITYYERVVRDRRKDINHIVEELAHWKKLKASQPVTQPEAPVSPDDLKPADLKPAEKAAQEPPSEPMYWEPTPDESIKQYQDHLEMAQADIESARTNNLEYGRTKYSIRNREQIIKCLLNHQAFYNPGKWLELARPMISHRKLLIKNTADYQAR